MGRVKLESSLVDIVVRMSEGNPGAITALMSCMEINSIIDPDDVFGAIGPVLSFDNLEIYGTGIYTLWSDICNRNTVKLLAVLRANQLGMVESSLLKDIAGRQDFSGKSLIDVEKLYSQVCERLSNFNKEGR